ncbi:MAG: hypothetical protein D6748_10555, partial [Calditrichaeota bacterium]
MMIQAKHICLVLMFFIFPVMGDEPLVVITHHDNPINNISLWELKQIYLGNQTSFEGGEKILLTEY